MESQLKCIHVAGVSQTQHHTLTRTTILKAGVKDYGVRSLSAAINSRLMMVEITGGLFFHLLPSSYHYHY